MSGRKSAKAAQPPKQRDLIGLLPCVEGVGISRHYWSVKRTGDFAWDNFLGAGLADQLLKTMRTEGHYMTLNLDIRAMIDCRRRLRGG